MVNEHQRCKVREKQSNEALSPFVCNMALDETVEDTGCPDERYPK
jgi:hypothetical protein